MLILFKTYNNFTIFLQNPNEKKNHEFSASSKRKQNSKKNID